MPRAAFKTFDDKSCLADNTPPFSNHTVEMTSIFALVEQLHHNTDRIRPAKRYRKADPPRMHPPARFTDTLIGDVVELILANFLRDPSMGSPMNPRIDLLLCPHWYAICPAEWWREHKRTQSETTPKTFVSFVSRRVGLWVSPQCGQSLLRSLEGSPNRGSTLKQLADQFGMQRVNELLQQSELAFRKGAWYMRYESNLANHTTITTTTMIPHRFTTLGPALTAAINCQRNAGILVSFEAEPPDEVMIET